MIFEWGSRDKEFRNLLCEKRGEEAAMEKAVAKAKKQNKSDEEIEQIYESGYQLSQHYDDRIAFAESRYLVSEAAFYHVPIPEFATNSPSWESPAHSQRWRLNEAARVNVLAAIRKEKRERWEERSRFLPYISAVTGLIGVAIGLLSVLYRVDGTPRDDFKPPATTHILHKVQNSH